MIGIINTESQNIGSIINCLQYLKIKFKLINKIEELQKVKLIILPGVGSFDFVIKNLKKKKLYGKKFIKEISKKKVIAICVGLQILFKKSDEGKLLGLNILEDIPVKRLDKIGLVGPLPHVGFNKVKLIKGNKEQKRILNNDFYFVHSFGVSSKHYKFLDAYAITEYEGCKIVSFLKYKNFLAVQFHPEKSGNRGLKFFKYFCDEKKNNF